MNKTLLLIFLLLLCFTKIKAQDSQEGTPYSFNHTGLNSLIDMVQVAPPDVNKLTAEDLDRAQKSEPYRVGVTVPINLSPSNSGTWTDLPGLKSSLWQLTIKSEGALSIGFGYAQFYMPEGAKLFLYNKTKDMVIGAYTSLNNTENLYFSNQRVRGDEITLELFIPNDKISALLLNITELNYFYRIGENDKAFSGSGSCEVNINCTEGNNWQTQKKGVCVIDIKVGSGWYNCTGSLVNNTSQNCTPYILLADHCHYDKTALAYASALDYNSWIFHFHYEAANCSGTTGPTNFTKAGCTLKAHDTYGSNNVGSDFCLVQINSAIATSLNVYYNGWDRNNTASTSGVGIHHPAGDIMKISTYTTPLVSYSAGGNGTHWQVTWAATANGHGVTEGGSSGSPIFNAAGKIVGTLTGGTSFCTALTSPDIYGKMYYHWDKNGSTAAKRLKDWLDPANTGATSLAGTATCSNGILKNSIEEEKTVIYPSPAHNEIFIEITTGDDILENVSIYNALGMLVKNSAVLKMESSKANISVSDLPDGVYYLTAQNGKKIFKGEFVKIK